MADNPYDQFLGRATPAAPTETTAPAPTRPDPLAGTMAEGMLTAPAPVASKANPYDQFVAGPGRESQASIGSVAKATGAAANRDVAGFLGGPVDAMTWLMNKIPGVDIDRPLFGSQRWRESLQAAGVDTTTQPRNEWERAGAAAGDAVAAVPGLMTGLGAARALPWVGEKLAPYAESLLPKTGAALAELEGIAGIGGGAGRVAADALPEDQKPLWGPLAETAGNIVGGGAAATAGAGLRALTGEAARLAGRFYQPAGFGSKEAVAPGLSATQGQQITAGQRLRGAATKPDELAGSLDVEQPDLVPGSKPTTYQLSGDPGVGNLERGAAARNPAPFVARRAEQNRARVGAIEGEAPFEAQPGAVGDYFRRQLADIDAAHASRETAARTGVDQATEGVGGTQFATPAEYGQQLRGNLSDLNTAAKARESSLWRAIDPDGNLTLPTSGLRQASAGIQGDMPSVARPMDGEERAIFDAADALPAVAPFEDVRALRGRITDETRRLAATPGNNQIIRRLTILRSSLDDALETGVNHVADQDAAMVAGGHIDANATAFARLQQEAADFISRRDAAAANLAGTASQGVRTGRPGNGGSRPAAVSSAPGAEGSLGRGPGIPSGNQGLPGEAPPTVDQDALDRYAAARQATRERNQTYGTGPVGQSLAPGPGGTPYRLPDSVVPAQFWRAGPRGSEGVQAFTHAGGDISTLQDYAASDLRRAAQRPDGTLDLGRYNAWVKRFDPALSEQPELRARFQTLADAQATLEQTAAARRAATSALEDSAARHFLGADPDIAVGKAFGTANPEQTFADLVRLTGGDPAASQGLKRAVTDYILRHFRGNAEAGDTGVNLLKADQYQTFITRQEKALRRLFGNDGFANLEAVSDDLRRANRSITGTKLPGGSNTAQDTAAMAKAEGGNTVLSHILAEAGAGAVGTVTGGPMVGAGAWLTTKVLGGMRSIGMDKVNDLVQAALLNPTLARTLLAKVPARPQPYILDRLARQLRALSVESATQAATRKPQPSAPAELRP